METNIEEIKNKLASFRGSIDIYEMPNSTFQFTEGVKYVVDACNAQWLVTDCSKLCQHFAKQENSIKISLEKHPENIVQLTFENGKGEILETIETMLVCFPLEEIKFYFVNNTLMLPSEF